MDLARFLKACAGHSAYAFEKSDAQERLGSENAFNIEMGGRSLRYTSNKIHFSDIDNSRKSREYVRVERGIMSSRKGGL